MVAASKNVLGALALVLAACGGRSELTGSPGAGQGGGAVERPTPGRGGTSGSSAGGTFAPSGGFGSGGGFGTAGSLSGSGGSAGAPPHCQLSVSDCRAADQIECAATHPLCEGRLDYLNRFSTRAVTYVRALATSSEGRVAIAGQYEGELRSDSSIDSDSKPLAGSSSGVDAFVASLTPSGVVEWGWSFGTDGSDTVEGIDFALDGDLIIQGSMVSPSSTRAGFVARIDTNGTTVWQRPLTSDLVTVGGITVDNNGDITAVGTFRGSLSYGSNTVSAVNDTGYLLRLTPDGDASMLTKRELAGVEATYSWHVEADDEDNLLIRGRQIQSVISEFVEKVTPSGEVLFTTLISGSTPTSFDSHTSLYRPAVDREMRILLAGASWGDLKLGDELLAGDALTFSPWLTQLSREGQRSILQRAPTIDALEPYIGAIAVDAGGNIAVVRAASTKAHVTKLRDDGSPIWTREVAGDIKGQVALACGSDGTIWFAGQLDGHLALDGQSYASRGDSDGLLLRFSP